MLRNGKLPTPITTRLESVQRSKGQSLGAVVAYSMGGKLRDIYGETYDFRSKEGVEAVSVHGWKALPGESQQNAIQRFVLEAQAREKHPRAVEARTLRGDLPAEAGPLLRSQLTAAAGDHIHKTLGVASLAFAHAAPDAGSGVNHHYHIVFSRREVDDRMRFGKDLPTFRTRRGSSDFMRGFREWSAEQYNRRTDMHGWERHYTGLSYKDLFEQLNEKRAEEGVEPLEPLKPTLHLGPAVMAQLRKRDRGKEVELKSDLVGKNERIRAENRERAARNEARIARDAGIKSVRLRMDAHGMWIAINQVVREEMSKGERPLGHYSDAERQLLSELDWQRGDLGQLTRDWIALPRESQDFLGRDHKIAYNDLSKRAVRLLTAENREIVRRLDGNRADTRREDLRFGTRDRVRERVR